MSFWKGLESFSGKTFRYSLESAKSLSKSTESLSKSAVSLSRFAANKSKDLWPMLLETSFKKNTKDFLYKTVDYCIDWALSQYSSDSFWLKYSKIIAEVALKELLYKAVEYCVEWAIIMLL
ncbi:hypothetical protein Tery_3067 [Trichodesmium erythraeum IMS101]|uniref:Uncharacterized protein n=1 Tax=Trichodesmium erythraeum (strain IMS101) TaxID=203124 RepID=Q10ZW3_TRIEI|nr:hypothetical protein [Trichodesmium erythraeum GBRTRLIN201]MDT9342064.1 hypothetical protein [Trichodesmium erythraeum 21-75]